MFGEKPKAFHLTDLGPDNKLDTGPIIPGATEAPKAATGPLVLESSDSSVTAEPVAETTVSGINVERNPAIDRLSGGLVPKTEEAKAAARTENGSSIVERISNDPEKGRNMIIGTAEAIVGFGEKAGEIVGNLSKKGIKSAGWIFGKIAEEWNAGMESAKSEKGLSGKDLEAAEASLKEGLGESDKATAEARDNVVSLSDHWSPETAATTTASIANAVERNGKSGKETMSWDQKALKGISNWLKKMWIHIQLGPVVEGEQLHAEAERKHGEARKAAARHKVRLQEQLQALKGEPAEKKAEEIPAPVESATAETTVPAEASVEVPAPAVAEAATEEQSAEVIPAPANEAAPEKPVYAFDAGIEEAFNQKTYEPIVPSIGGAEPLRKPEQPQPEAAPDLKEAA